MAILLNKRIDSNNAFQVEKEILAQLEDQKEPVVVLDASELEYISSAGLRVLLSAQKIMSKQGSMKIINVNDVVMEIFEVTGFVDILTIE